jgi:hypothetical protein
MQCNAMHGYWLAATTRPESQTLEKTKIFLQQWIFPRNVKSPSAKEYIGSVIWKDAYLWILQIFMSKGGKYYERTKETAEAVGFYDNMRKLIPAVREARVQVIIVPHHRWRESDYKGWKPGGWTRELIRGRNSRKSLADRHQIPWTDGLSPKTGSFFRPSQRAMFNGF